MPVTIKKEVVFGVLILLLLLLFVLNMTKKGHTGLKFGDVLGDDGVTIVVDANRNALDSSITFQVPANTPTINSVASKIYKFPLLYLIDPNSSGSTVNTIDNDSSYDKPPPTALINSANKASSPALDVTTFGTGVVGSTGYYAPSTVGSGKYFPNLLNLVNLYSNTPGISAPATGGFTLNGDSLTLSSTGTWVISGLSNYVNCPLINGRTYVLGLALQLTDNPYVNFDGASRTVLQSPLTRRYGNFKYVSVTYSISGLTIATPDMPSGATAATLQLTI